MFITQRPLLPFSPLCQQSAKDRTLIYGCVCVGSDLWMGGWVLIYVCVCVCVCVCVHV